MSSPSDKSPKVVNLLLIFGVFVSGLGGGVAFPILPTLGTVLGITPFMVGLILSINRATRVVLNTPAGQALDRFGTRRPMIFGFAVTAFVPFGYVLGMTPQYVPIESSTIFLLARVGWGIGSAFVFIGAFRTIALLTESSNRGKWIGYMRGGQSLGFPVGLASGGLLADLLGYSEAFLFAGIVNMAALVVAVFVLPDLTGNADASKVNGLRALPTILAADIRIPSIASVNFIIRFLYSGVLLSTIVVFLDSTDIDLFAFSELGTGGLVMALGAVAVSVMTLFSGRYSDTVTNRAYVTIPTIALFALGFGILGTTPTATTVFFAVLMIGAGVGGSNPPLLAYLSDITADDDLGKIGGVYNMFGDLGSTFGPLLALPLVPYIGFRGIYFACVILAIVAELLVVGSLLGMSSPSIKSDKADAD